MKSVRVLRSIALRPRMNWPGPDEAGSAPRAGRRPARPSAAGVRGPVRNARRGLELQVGRSMSNCSLVAEDVAANYLHLREILNVGTRWPGDGTIPTNSGNAVRRLEAGRGSQPRPLD